MKRIILTLLIILAGVSVWAEGSVPEMRPSSPDVPSEVQTTEQPSANNAEPIQEDEEYVEEYNGDDAEEEPSGKEQTKTTEQPVNNVQPTPEDKTNPINKDSSKEIVNNGVVPVNNLSNEDEVVDVKKLRKEQAKRLKQAKKEAKRKYKQAKPTDGKPDLRKYKDANIDPYVQTIYQEKTKEEKLQEERDAVPKTYTQDEYEQMYRDMQAPDFSFIHGVDPDQYYDMKDTTWSPYPLFRLNSPLYFKNITVEPGYYLLTPREYKGNWYVLFKESGAVKYIIPVIAKGFTPANYYRDNLPELDMKKSQRWQIKFLNAWGKYIRKSKRKPAIQTNIELTDLDNNFLLMDLYYSHYKYSCLFRIEKY